MRRKNVNVLDKDPIKKSKLETRRKDGDGDRKVNDEAQVMANA